MRWQMDRSNKAGIGVCLALGSAILLGYEGAGIDLSLSGLMALMHGLSWKGFLLYVVCATLGVALFLPSTPLAVAGGLVFAPWLGFLALQASSLAAACLIFVVVRLLKTGEGLHTAIPLKIRSRIHDNALVLIVYARTFMVPDPAVNYGASALPISFREYLLGTLLGTLPHNLALVMLCSVARDAILRGNPAAILQWKVVPALLIACTGILLVHLLQHRRTPHPAPVPPYPR